MKRMLMIICVLCSSELALAQSTIDKFFQKYQDDESFTVINITPKMFNMFSKFSVDDPDAKKVTALASKLKGLRILIKEDTKDGQKLYREASQFLGTGMEELMSVRDKETDLKFMVRENTKGNIQELVMLVGSTDEFVALTVFGDFSIAEISEIAGGMNIDGFQNLGQLRDNKGAKGKK
ncbi:DUF4252 domain-containing protein [Chitinophaga sp. GCM10012297]|uniref:DUF4252 domain-containing protein n=1 Tax=Chitinophaga chungangae TaxID=2821488 RepID=A0ABS3YI28_9BACT|nr:DUF4252 domain-containing protein [Chitinophaga chungangae]MBO9154341.1 DUF4252 domain-containing protein [Chitinophaga chungangae]